MRTFEYTIKDKLGIHARPAGLLVNAVRALDSEAAFLNYRHYKPGRLAASRAVFYL